MEQIRAFLNTQDIDALWSQHDAVVWVDWREEDDAIVTYCENILKTGQLSAAYQDADNQLGYQLTVQYGGNTSIVAFNPADVNRDATLITLNEVLSPDYQVRLWMDSIGGDTLAFVPLSTAQWTTLEAEFGVENVQHHFARITAQSRMFCLSMKEVGVILEKRKKQ